MLEITTTSAERSHLREGMGTLIHTIDLATLELHDLYAHYFEHSESQAQKDIPWYDAEYLGRRLWAIENAITASLEEWAMFAGDTHFRGQEYEVNKARRLLEIREAEELEERAFIQIERMPKGKAKDEATAELWRAQGLQVDPQPMETEEEQRKEQKRVRYYIEYLKDGLKADLDNLMGLEWSGQGTGRNRGDYARYKFVSSYRVRGTTLTINFDIDIARYLIQSYEMQWPTALLLHDNRDQNLLFVDLLPEGLFELCRKHVSDVSRKRQAVSFGKCHVLFLQALLCRNHDIVIVLLSPFSLCGFLPRLCLRGQVFFVTNSTRHFDLLSVFNPARQAGNLIQNPAFLRPSTCDCKSGYCSTFRKVHSRARLQALLSADNRARIRADAFRSSKAYLYTPHSKKLNLRGFAAPLGLF